MLAILRAQLWELGHGIWLELIYRLGFSLVFMALPYCFTILGSYLGLDMTEIHKIIPMLLLWNAIPWGTWANESGDSPSGARVCLGFTRPISTLQLVIVPMLFTVFVALAGFLIPASLYFWLLLGGSFSVAGSSALVATIVCCCIAISWSTPAGAGRLSAFVMMNAALFALMFVSIDPASWDFAWYVYAGLALLSAIAFAFTVLGVQRRRYGESLCSSLIDLLFRRGDEPGQRKRGPTPIAGTAQRVLRTIGVGPLFRRKPFRNQWTAQCWYEFRRIGKWLLFPLFMLPIALLALVCVGNYFDPDVEACLYVFAGGLVFCPIANQMVGTGAATWLRNKDGTFSFPAFDATCPMRCDHLIAMKLLIVASGTLAGWLMMAVVAILYSPFIGDGGALAKVGESLSGSPGEVSAYWWMAVAISALPLLISTTPMMLAHAYLAWIPSIPGRYLLPSQEHDGGESEQSGLTCLIVCVIAIVNILLVVVDIFSDWSFRNLWIAHRYLIPVVIVGLCVFALKKSLVSGFVGKPYFVASLSLWALFLLTTTLLAIRLLPAIPSGIPLSAYLICIAMLLVPLAATVVAPMALASHRHA